MAKEKPSMEYETYIPRGSKILAEEPRISELEKKFGIKVDHIHKTMSIAYTNREKPHKKMKIGPEIRYIKIIAPVKNVDNFAEYYNLP